MCFRTGLDGPPGLGRFLEDGGATSGVDGRMRRIGPLDEFQGHPIIVMGTFDGVHRGHQRLLEHAAAWAGEQSADWLVVTFDPPPSVVLRGEAAPRSLTPLEEKLEWLDRWGVPGVAVIPFTPALAKWPGDMFLERVVQGQLHAAGIIEGPTFTYGAGGRGNLETLKAWGAANQVAVRVVPPVEVGGAVLSSSRIRAAVAAGDLAAAAAALGRPYAAAGVVEPGDGRGRTIGVPTANLALPAAKLMPPAGVYAGWAWAGNGRWLAVANFGSRPTFDGRGLRLEVHLLDAPPALDLYGVRLSMSFGAALRPEQRFAGVDALAAQIRRDITSARALADAGALPPPAGPLS